jgi:dTDP-4-dehydrorhamnose 3,5-epimerase
VRVGSPTFGEWEGVTLSAETKRQFYLPPGFAHGFCVVSERAMFSYKCTDFYAAPSEIAIAWDDPEIGIDWPIQSPQLSARDQQSRRLRDIPQDSLPRYE